MKRIRPTPLNLPMWHWLKRWSREIKPPPQLLETEFNMLSVKAPKALKTMKNQKIQYMYFRITFQLISIIILKIKSSFRSSVSLSLYSEIMLRLKGSFSVVTTWRTYLMRRFQVLWDLVSSQSSHKLAWPARKFYLKTIKILSVWAVYQRREEFILKER